MISKDARLLKGIQEGEVLTDFYRQGGTPDGARSGTELLIGCYFENPQRLKDLPIEFLFPIAREIASMLSRGSTAHLDQALGVCRSAYRSNTDEALRVLMETQDALEASLNIYWSLFHLQQDRDELDLEEFLWDTLRLLGAILEGLVKPLVFGLAEQISVMEMGANDSGAKTVTFGAALDRVAKRAPDPRLSKIRGIPVSQWRNVAQHLAASLEGDTIVCRYGSSGRNVVRLTRDELQSVLVEAMILFRVLRTSHEVFFFDHFADLREKGLIPRQPAAPQRAEATFSMFLVGIASQGFTVVETALTEDWSTLVVQDVSDLPPRERRLHASQFIAPLGEFRPAPMLSVEYRERDGTPSLLTILPLDVVRRAVKNDDTSILVEEATLVDLKQIRPEDLQRISRSGSAPSTARKATE